MNLFSTRNKPKSAEYSYEIPSRVRDRFMITLKSILDETVGMGFVIREIESTLLKRFGTLKTNRNSQQSQPLANHVYACSDEEFLDIIEIMFKVAGYGGYYRGVNACNEIFDQENIGYELTPFVISEELPPPGSRVRPLYGPATQITAFPQIIRKTEKVLHTGTIEPALQVLSDTRFSVANAELVDGLVKLRRGQYQDSILACGSAIETVLKTICTLKKWPYVENKDTLTDLTLICQREGLFFNFYKTALDCTGIMRNRMSAHGKGPNPEFIPTKEHAEHMAYTCCANAVFLISQAKL